MKCQCDEEGTGKERQHKPGCCLNPPFRLYIRNGKKKWLCGNCYMPGDKEISETELFFKELK